jgi:formylglycine-generating enzyme
MFDKKLVRGLMTAALVASVASVHADVFNMPNGQTSISLVQVGDPGNVADTAVMIDGTTGYGSVGYNYSIDKYDVTMGQYTAFLNAVAKTDTYGLYNSDMAGGGGVTPLYSLGISQRGSSGNYSYSVTGSNPQAANMPVYSETWGDAARFCNWLQNGQPSGTEGTGTTETGAYTLNGDVLVFTESRNAGATYFIPNENEWYKAAYYSGGGTNSAYYTYATKSNIAPNNSLILATTSTNDANYEFADPTNHLTPVGTFAASPGPYGTYDMGGDVFQWNEAIISGLRCIRGGGWDANSSDLASSYRDHIAFYASEEGSVVGFRVASGVAVPEPGGIALLLTGAAGLLADKWRKKHAAWAGRS